MIWWAAAVGALRLNRDWRPGVQSAVMEMELTVIHVEAHHEQEARARGLYEAQRIYPAVDGWMGHMVNVKESV